MFDQLFERPHALHRQCSAPLADERRRYVLHCIEQGIAALPLIGFHCATKWAVEALHDSLAQEVRAFGLKVTLVEPGAYATDFTNRGWSGTIRGVPEAVSDASGE